MRRNTKLHLEHVSNDLKMWVKRFQTEIHNKITIYILNRSIYFKIITCIILCLVISNVFACDTNSVFSDFVVFPVTGKRNRTGAHVLWNRRINPDLSGAYVTCNFCCLYMNIREKQHGKQDYLAQACCLQHGKQDYLAQACCLQHGKEDNLAQACCLQHGKQDYLARACCLQHGKEDNLAQACCLQHGKEDNLAQACCLQHGKQDYLARACCLQHGKEDNLAQACCLCLFLCVCVYVWSARTQIPPIRAPLLMMPLQGAL